MLITTILCLPAVYSQPVISTVSPSTAPVGASVVISGTGFNSNATSNIVQFGGVRAAVTQASATALTVTVPSGTCPHLPLSVTNNALTGYAPLGYITSFAGGGVPLTNASFESGTGIPAPGSLYDIATADLNNDGKPDLVTVNQNPNFLSVYKNSSTPAAILFGTRTDYALGCNPYSVRVADLDGDGMQDIIVGSANSPIDSIIIFRNTSTSGVLSFTRATGYVAVTTYNMAIGDIDKDGKVEIVSTTSSGIHMLKNNSSPGSISFTDAGDFSIGQYPQDVEIADINGNGKPDIITCTGDNKLSILNNQSTPGNISLAGVVSFPTGGNSLIAIAVSDIDNDGRADVSICGYSSAQVYIMKNTGTGSTVSFTQGPTLSTSYGTWGIRTVDINGDGKRDIICPTYQILNSVKIFRNTSSGTISFDSYKDYYTSNTNWRLVVADFRNSGSPDIASLDQSGNMIAVLRNKITDPPTLTSFSPVAAGQGYEVTIKGTNLSSVTNVSFGGVNASQVTVLTDTSILAMVGTGASGIVQVTTGGGNASKPGFTFVPSPTISSFSPMQGPVGQKVKITGVNFDPVPGNNYVYFGAAKATVTSASASSLTVTVPAGATYQPISVTTAGYTIYSQKPFHVVFPDGTLNTATFQKKIHQFDGYQNYLKSASIADIDGDGLSDIVVPLHGTVLSDISFYDSIAVYRNTTVNGRISFAKRICFKTTGSFTASISIGDLNSDGKLDVIACNQRFNGSYSSIELFRNISTPGNISFAPAVNYSAGDYPSQVVVRDVDGDGKPDLALANGSGSLYVYKNNSTLANISYNNPMIIPVANGSAMSVCLTDMDGDGKPDLLAPNTVSDSIDIFRNTSTIGTISFAPIGYFNAGRKTSYLTAADLDGDGKSDLVMGSGYYDFGSVPANDTAVSIARNSSSAGNISFGTAISYPLTWPANVLVTDLDGDGKPDLAAASNDASFSLFKNISSNGNLALAPKIVYNPATSTALSIIDAGDLDGDGKPDMVLADVSAAAVSVMINQNGSDLELCPGGNGLLYSNLTGFSYQWQLNSGLGYNNITNGTNYSGTTTAVLNLLAIPSSFSGYKYRCVVNGVAGRESVVRFVNRWTGAISTAWETPGNWSCGSIPDINTNVIINSGTVVISSNNTIRTLTVNADANMSINPGFNLTILH